MSTPSQFFSGNVVTSASSRGLVFLAMLSCVAPMSPASAAEYRGGSNTRILDTLIDPKLGVDSEPILLISSGAVSTPNVGQSSGSSSVSVRTGGIHVESVSESEVLAGPGNFYGQSEARGSFSDEFVVSAPNIAAGTAVRATVAFGVSGTLDGQGSGSGSWGTGLTWQASFGLFARNDGIRWNGEGRLSVDCCNTLAGGDLPGTRFFDLDFFIGETIRLEMGAFVQARSGAGSTVAGGTAKSIAYANFSNTMSWQGITSLADLNGASVGPFSAMSSSSGFDYANAYVTAVPEPEKWLLWLCGFIGLIAVRRARSHGSALTWAA